MTTTARTCDTTPSTARETTTAPTVVNCDVQDARADRFDVRVDGVTYLGAALHGAGGLLARGMSPEAFATYWRRRQTRDAHTTLVHVVATATESETVTAHPREVEILRVWPVTPHARRP